jgi:hypothetical protein
MVSKHFKMSETLTKTTTNIVGKTNPVTVPMKGDVINSSFGYGGVPMRAEQIEPLAQVRIPKFDDLEDERAFRKLHHVAALRWLGLHGYNNEGAGGHVSVRDPILKDHFWINPHAKSFPE